MSNRGVKSSADQSDPRRLLRLSKPKILLKWLNGIQVVAKKTTPHKRSKLIAALQRSRHPKKTAVQFTHHVTKFFTTVPPKTTGPLPFLHLKRCLRQQLVTYPSFVKQRLQTFFSWFSPRYCDMCDIAQCNCLKGSLPCNHVICSSFVRQAGTRF